MHHCGMAHVPAYVDVSLLKTWMYILYADSLHLSSPLQWAAITVHSMTSTIRTSMPAALRRLYVSNSNIVSSQTPFTRMGSGDETTLTGYTVKIGEGRIQLLAHIL